MNVKIICTVVIPVFLACCLTGYSYSQEDVIEIVKQVQINSQNQYENISSVIFSGRSKNYMYIGSNVFSMNFVPEFEEYYFNGCWIKPDSLRIVITALRKAAKDHPLGYNSELNNPDYFDKIDKSIALPNPFLFSYDMSTMKMNTGTRINKKGERVSSWPLFPFAKGADSLYTYEIRNKIGFGNTDYNMRKIIELYVSPKTGNIPGVSGMSQIDADANVVVGSDIVFNEAARLIQPGNTHRIHIGFNKSYIPINVREDYRIKTRKVLYNSTYWLPQNVEEELLIELMDSKIKFYREVEFFTYNINPELSDSTGIIDKKLSYNRNPQFEKRIFNSQENLHTLTQEEEEVIVNQIENTSSAHNIGSELFALEAIAQDALKLKLGHRSGKYFKIAAKMGDNIMYNRVEGLRLDYGISLSNALLENMILGFKAGYGFKDNRWKGGISGLYFVDDNKKFFIDVNLYNTLVYNESKKLFSNGKNTFSSLFFKTDYRDYYYQTGGNIGIGYFVNNNFAVKMCGVNQTENNAVRNTNFSVFRKDEDFRMNPEIQEGKFRGLRTVILYRSSFFNSELVAEYCNDELLKSDFSYSFVKTNFDWNYKISQGGTLFFSLSAGFSDGRLPPQRWFDFGGKSLFNYTGNLRGVEYKEFTGERMVMGTIEYTLEWGSSFAVKKRPFWEEAFIGLLKMTFWSAWGWSELSEKNNLYFYGIDSLRGVTDGLYREFGIGIGDRMNFLRFDIIRNSISGTEFISSLNFFQ